MGKYEEELILVTDGGYDGQDNIVLAKAKNVKLATTVLNGKEALDALADFGFNKDANTTLDKMSAQNLNIIGKWSLVF